MGIPPENQEQIKARNIITDKTSSEFNKMKKELPIHRSPSNFLLKSISNDKQKMELIRQR